MGLALLVILIPLALIFVYADESWKVLATPDRLEALTSPDGKEFHPQWHTVIWFHTIAIGVLLLAALIQVFLFITHHPWFPKFFVGFMVALSLFVLASTLMITRIPTVQNDHAGRYALRLVLAMVVAVGSIAYTRVSPRVKFTVLRR